jgi:hypothetical protein
MLKQDITIQEQYKIFLYEELVKKEFNEKLKKME